MVRVDDLINDVKNLANNAQGVDADGYYGYQCVDLINYYLRKYFSITLQGNAIDLPNSAKARGLTYIQDAWGVNPKKGDAVIFSVSSHQYGHVGWVVEDSDGVTIKTVEQNVDGNADFLERGGVARYRTREFNAGGLKVLGWIRPKYDNASSAPTVSTKGQQSIATKRVNGDLFSGLVTDVDPNIMNSDGNRVAIDRIVIHHNAGTSDVNARMTWYVSSGVGTSAHYQVTPNKIWGCVGEESVAYHAGNYSMNQRSIGIEHLNSTGAPSWLIAEETYLNSAKLIADISTRYNIPIDRQHIIGHKEVPSATQCPGGIDLNKLVRLAKEVKEGKKSQAPTTTTPQASQDANTSTAQPPKPAPLVEPVVGGNIQLTTNHQEGTITIRAINVTSNKGISYVTFPIWTDENGQDDIKWCQASRQSDGSYVYVADKKLWNNKEGKYIIHAYVVNQDGSVKGFGAVETTLGGDTVKGLNSAVHDEFVIVSKNNSEIKHVVVSAEEFEKLKVR